MQLSEQAEELLESLYATQIERHGEPDTTLLKDMASYNELIESGCVDSHSKRLTPQGIEEGTQCVRRHRLAERLMADVLDVAAESIHDAGCRFEHVLHRGIENKICILLGHPRTCPHGKPIPRGACCTQSQNSLESIVKPLSQLEKGAGGTVAYVHTHDADVLNKIMGMNVLPGAALTLNQRSPTFVFTMGHSQFAVDRTIADNIFVRANS